MPLSAYRKLIPHLAAVAFAFLSAIADAQDSGGPLTGVTLLMAVAASLQAILTYWAGNPWTKLTASGAMVLISGMIAAVTDGHITGGEWIVIAAQLAAWAASGAVDNEPAGGVEQPA